MRTNQKLPNLKPGDVVAGRFRVVETIGSGGFSVVYRAHQQSMNRFVALKILKPTASNDEKIVERFRREALYASHLSHPNTITLFDYGHTEDGLCYIAMEHLTGQDLSDVVQLGKPMELRRVWNILVQTCRSLAEAHRLGLVHRDLKPENIFLVKRDDQEFVKVLDFGVSKAISDFAGAGPRTMAPLTQEGTVFGTPLYMAPEQAMAEAITPAVDTYAMGHIAYEMITGHAAYGDCTNAMDVMLRQINDPPLELPEPWDQTPFNPLIYRSTLKEADKRIQDASQLLEYLHHEAFKPYMDLADRQPRPRTLPQTPAVDTGGSYSGDYTIPPDSIDEVEEIYRWELDLLDDVYQEVRDLGQMRLVVVRGAPGTGRSNLLRAFIKRHLGDDGLTVVHRDSHADNARGDAGLEADLACVTGGGLEGRGVPELNRMLRAYYDRGSFGPIGSDDVDSDSAPLSSLSSQRETFLTRITVPFRKRAEQGMLLWGVENLERIDTLSLAFLDRFFRDLQAHPAPIMIVTTVYPDDLMRRPGLLRYTQGLLQATKPLARQLSLVPPGERKGDEDTAEEMESVPADLAADGSYVGQPAMETFDETDTARGALTEKMEIFTGLDEQTAAMEEEAERSEADVAFDTVLGYLAQLGDEVPEDLWTLARARILPGKFMQLADFIVEQAERFGILHRRTDTILFTQPGFAEHLRASFADLVDPVPAHRALAGLMLDYYEQPGRVALRIIVGHLMDSHQPWQALGLLQEAAGRAFESLDLDTAREHYLLIQKLMEGVDEGRHPSAEAAHSQAQIDRAKIWSRLGEVHGALGEHGAAEDALKRAIAEATDDDAALRGRAYKILGDLAAGQERYGDAKTSYRKARDSFREAGQANAFVAAMGAMGYSALLDGKPEEAEEILGLALEKARRLGSDVLTARVGRYMGEALTRRGRFVDAIEHLGESMGLFESLGQQTPVLECLVQLGDAAYAARKYSDARAYFTRAIALSSSMHVSLPESPHLGLARALAALGNLSQAEAHVSEALASSGTAADRLQMAQGHLLSGDLYLAAQDYGEAIGHYRRLEEIAQNVGHTTMRLDAAIRQAYVAFDSGSSSQAYDQLSKAMQLAESVGNADGELQVRAHVIYLQLLEHDFRAHGDTFGSLLRMSHERGLTRAPVLCNFFKADVLAARGEVNEARVLLRAAHDGAASIGNYAMFVPIARRDYILKQKLGQLGDPQAQQGYALGALIPPEIGARRFDESRVMG